MIEESYVSFETAKLLKEAGFEANLKTRYVEEEKDEWAFWESGTKRSDYNYFDDTIACPTQASACKASNIPISVISEGMGHDSEETTRIYLASLDTSVVDKANRKIIKQVAWTSK